MYGWKIPYKIYDQNKKLINLHDKKFQSMICGFPGEDFQLDRLLCKYILILYTIL